MDLKAEVAKCDKKIDLVRLNLDKLYKVLSQADYQTAVPEAVQMSNEEKVWRVTSVHRNVLIVDGHVQRKTLEVELSALQESREMFTKLQ